MDFVCGVVILAIVLFSDICFGAPFLKDETSFLNGDGCRYTIEDSLFIMENDKYLNPEFINELSPMDYSAEKILHRYFKLILKYNDRELLKRVSKLVPISDGDLTESLSNFFGRFFLKYPETFIDLYYSHLQEDGLSFNLIAHGLLGKSGYNELIYSKFTADILAQNVTKQFLASLIYSTLYGEGILMLDDLFDEFGSYIAPCYLDSLGDITYLAQNVSDGNLSTAWAFDPSECDKGYIIHKVDSSPKSVTVMNGYQKTESLFVGNSRAKDVVFITFNHQGESNYSNRKLITLKDTRQPQVVDISDIVTDDSYLIVVEITSIYRGLSCLDVCISEMQFK